jgi:hypothetical protein
MPLLDPVARFQSLIPLGNGPAQLQLRHHLLREQDEGGSLLLCEVTGHMIEHTQGSQGNPIGGSQHRPGIEAQARLPCHERIAGKTRVLDQIRNDGQSRLEHGAEADRAVEGRLAHPKPHLGHEPLPALVDEADESNGSLTAVSGKLYQIVECGLWWRVENPVATQGCEPVALCPGGMPLIVQHEPVTAGTTRENVLDLGRFK